MPIRPLSVLVLATLATSCIVYVRTDSDEDGSHPRVTATHAFAGTPFDGPRVRGNGESGQEERACEAAHAVRVEGAIDVEVSIGLAPSVVVEGDSNVLAYVTTKVEDGVLTVSLARGSYELRERLVVRFMTSHLESAEVVGSGDLAVAGLAGGDLRVAVLGSGDVALAGRVERFDLSVTGSGDVSATDLATDAVRVELNGSGNVDLGEVEALSVRLSGSGDVRYTGRPGSLETELTGSGSVRGR